MNRIFGLQAGAFFGWMVAYFWKVVELTADQRLDGWGRVVETQVNPFTPDAMAVTGFCGFVGMIIGRAVDVSNR